MGVDELLEILARSGLNDADYDLAAAIVRQMNRRAEAGDALAEAVEAAASYQPPSVIQVLSVFQQTPAIAA